MKWLFILLVTISQPTDKKYEIAQVPGIRDIWPIEIQQGDQAAPGVGYHRAVLFETKELLDEYLAKTLCDGAVLLDLKAGKEYIVKQDKLTRKVKVEQEQFVKFEVTLTEAEK